MTTNPYFDNYTNEDEQNLLNDLIVESIKIYGQDMYYIPRRLVNYDKLYGTDDQSEYNTYHTLEFYIRTFEGFAGDQDFISKFAGVEIRDQIRLSVARSRFTEELAADPDNITRPRGGDIIYFPLNQKCFQIKFVNKFEMFYPLGSLYLWDLNLELFEYSDEKFNTGVEAIDRLQNNFSTNVLDYALLNENGVPILTESGNILTTERFDFTRIDPLADNDFLDAQSNNILDWSKQDPFGEWGLENAR